MVRPFAPRDFLRVRRHQATGTPLDLETAILPGSSPLQTALVGLVPWRGRSLFTLILDPSDASYPEGFLQARVRPEGADADLVFIAPGLACGGRAAISWRRLISESGHWLGARGLQRLHICTDPEDGLAGQIVRQLGFHDHAHETVFRLSDPNGESATERSAGRSFPTPGGAWLYWPSENLDPVALKRMVVGAAREARQTQSLPLYASVRSGKDSHRRALLDAGFEPIAERIRWVGATAAHVMEPAWRESPRHDAGAEAAGSRSPSRVEGPGGLSELRCEGRPPRDAVLSEEAGSGHVERIPTGTIS